MTQAYGIEDPQGEQAKQLLLEVHKTLFPERYMTEAQMEAQVYGTVEDGYYQWDSDTPDAIASLLGPHVDLFDGDPDPTPLERRPT